MSMFGGNMAVPSLADIAAVTRNGNGNNGGFGDGNGWWVLIILFAIFGGWGNGGYGNGGGNATQGALTRSDLCQDMNFSEMAGGIRGISQGICDSTFALNNTMVNGFAGVNNAVCDLGYSIAQQFNNAQVSNMQGNFAVQQAINANSVANMQNTNALSTQLAQCCCENRQGQADIKYAMATDTCAITNAINQAAQNIMQNDNANYRQLHDEQVAAQIEALKQRNAEQASLIQSLNLAQSQANQNNFFQSQIEGLYDRLSPCPRPAYWVQNPNCCQNPWGPFNANVLANGLNGNNGTCGCNNYYNN